MKRERRDPHDTLVLLVVGGLLLLALVTLGILGALAFRMAEPSDLLLGALIALLSNATGALGAVLTQTGRSAKVEVENGPSNPVSTAPVPPEPFGG